MFLKTFNITLGVLVAFSVWCAALLVVMLALHVVEVAILTIMHLMIS